MLLALLQGMDVLMTNESCRRCSRNKAEAVCSLDVVADRHLGACDWLTWLEGCLCGLH